MTLTSNFRFPQRVAFVTFRLPEESVSTLIGRDSTAPEAQALRFKEEALGEEATAAASKTTCTAALPWRSTWSWSCLPHNSGNILMP